MATNLEVLLTVHFFTFLLAELVLVAPFGRWVIFHFVPAGNHLLRSDYVTFLERRAVEALSAGILLEQALACLHLIETGYANGNYRNMTELRNAALLRMMATMLGSTVHSVSVFAF